MIVLDENVLASQRIELERRRFRPCQIGIEVGRKGMQDNEIVSLLLKMRRPTFLTRDSDFFDKSLCHQRLCLVHMAIGPLEVAQYARRLLRHPQFKSWSQRQGRVVRVSVRGLAVWRSGAMAAVQYRWDN